MHGHRQARPRPRSATLLAVTFWLWALLPSSGLPANQPSGSPYAEVVRRLSDAIHYELEQKDLPAFSIALVDGDKMIWSKGFGYVDRDRQRRATSRTVYRVGSVSKLFTDLAVMQLVEQGRLELDAAVTDLLPDFHPRNPFSEPITLRRLMSHLSGLVREPPVGHYFDPTQPTLRETIRSLNHTALVYRPGSRTKYSNAGVSVVGYLLQQQTRTPFDAYIRRQILAPLQMRSTSFQPTGSIKKELATGWMWTYDGRRFEAPTFLLGTAPAGNLYSTVEDLARFIAMLHQRGTLDGHRIVKPSTLQEMWSPQTGPDGQPTSFGIGFHVLELDGHRKVGHGGAVYGFATQLESLPQQRIGVAAALALDGANGLVRRLTDYALRLMLAHREGKPLPNYVKTKPVPLELARELAGFYYDGGDVLELNELSGKLTLRRGSTETELRLHPSGDLVVDSPLGFGPRIEAESHAISIDARVFVRRNRRPPPAIPETWKGLIGEYGWDHNTLYILEDRGRLYALIEWFFYYPLTELSPNEFAFPDYGLYHGEKLIFHRDAAGRATKVVAAGVEFLRRNVGTDEGQTFRITPLRPVEELRRTAMAARPPREPGPFRQSDWVEISKLDSTIRLDIRYATTNNFMGAVFYREARAFMQRPAAEALVRAHRKLAEHGLGLMIFDAYRPWHVTKMFWDATPEEMKQFVADPREGSRHNRGCAVDLTLYELSTGKPVTMVSGYDEFSPRSFPAYPGGTARQRWYRRLLRQTMESEGFSVYQWEWWHFDYRDWRKYAIGNRSFEEIAGSRMP